jgi:hypothetical protein
MKDEGSYSSTKANRDGKSKKPRVRCNNKAGIKISNRQTEYMENINLHITMNITIYSNPKNEMTNNDIWHCIETNILTTHLSL